MSDYLSDAELVGLSDLLAGAAEHEACCYPAGWCRWFAEQAETLRAELAQRKITRAVRNDPCAYFWFGRL